MYLQHSFFWLIFLFRSVAKTLLTLWKETDLFIFLPGQTAFSLLLFAGLQSLDYFGFQLDATLLNSRLEGKKKMPKVSFNKLQIRSKSLLCYLDCSSYLTDVISYVLFPCSFERNFCTHYAHKYSYFVLCLVNLIATPTAKFVRYPLSTKVGEIYTIWMRYSKAKEEAHLILFKAVLVTTSPPCSKRRGIRFAKRNMLIPCRFSSHKFITRK